MKTADTAGALVRGKVEELGFDLYDVTYQKEQGAWVLTLFIDKEGGVTIDDCETVSRAVEPLLDEKDPIADAYFLSVSSVGLDRPLRLDKDFARNLGKPVTVSLYAPVHKKKTFTGTLSAYDAERFTLALDTGEMTLGRKDAAKIVPYIDFKEL